MTEHNYKINLETLQKAEHKYAFSHREYFLCMMKGIWLIDHRPISKLFKCLILNLCWMMGVSTLTTVSSVPTIHA